MLFNSFEFLLAFLPLALLGFRLLENRGGSRHLYVWLTACSLIYYGWWMPSMSWLILASIGVNFALGRRLVERPGREKALLWVGVALNLAPLLYYKYAAFALNTAAWMIGREASFGALLLPLGISFFTFQQITFLVDAHRGEAKRYRFFEYATFVTFFPQLIAGPIVHHGEMMPQFERRRARPFRDDLAIGLSIFVIGLFKKVVLADSLAELASPVFATALSEPVGFGAAWVGALGYTFQLYFDFSGYSDMALGLARMFGIVLPVNFLSPYKATSIVEFWRRWHITLSRFLRDYVYIPLGGNRKGPAKRHLFLMTTMLVGGLWHGAGWTFVFWGAFHGALLVVNHAWNHLVGATRAARLPLWRSVAGWALTFGCVVVGWVFFRAETFAAAVNLLRGMLRMNDATGSADGEQLLLIGAAAAVCLLGRNVVELFSAHGPATGVPATGGDRAGLRIRFSPTPAWALALGLMLYLAVARMAGGHSSEFLYFNF
jgi:D-alanyl-lipoteichoic acid acyltransferase DltB (MBOAT superfamily)